MASVRGCAELMVVARGWNGWLLLSGSKRSVLKRQSRNMIDDCYEYRRRVRPGLEGGVVGLTPTATATVQQVQCQPSSQRHVPVRGRYFGITAAADLMDQVCTVCTVLTEDHTLDNPDGRKKKIRYHPMAHATPDLCDHVQPRRCRCRATSIPEAAAANWAFSQAPTIK